MQWLPLNWLHGDKVAALQLVRFIPRHMLQLTSLCALQLPP
jgi:hypothetical protein